MSYVGINPYEDIEPFIDTKPKTSYPDSVKKEIKLLSFSENGLAVPFGSYIYRIQKYPGDIDLLENYVYGESVEENVENFYKSLKRVIKRIQKNRYHYYSETKIGLDKRYEIDIGVCDEGFYTPAKGLLKRIRKMYKKQLFSLDEFKLIKYVLKKGQVLDSDDYDVVFNEIRKHRILRWTEKEIFKGVKTLPGNKKITIKEALVMKTPIKIDEIIFINGRFIEQTNFIQISYLKSGQIIPINIDISTYNDPYVSLPREIEKLYFSDYYYSPFKMIKRMYSFLRHAFYFDKDETARQPLLNILPIISSNVSLIYQIKSEIDTMILIYEKIKSPPKVSIDKQLDEMKGRLVNAIELTTDEINNFNELVDLARVTSNKTKKIKILKAINKILKPIINSETIEYLNRVNFNPPPDYLLPKHKTYYRLVRKPEDNPENPVDVIKEEMKESVNGSGCYDCLNTKAKKLDELQVLSFVPYRGPNIIEEYVPSEANRKPRNIMEDLAYSKHDDIIKNKDIECRMHDDQMVEYLSKINQLNN